MKTLHAQQLSNLRDAKCKGEADLEGRHVLVYRSFPKSDADPAMNGFWTGGRATVYLEPGTRRALRFDQYDAEGSFRIDNPGDVSMQTFAHEPNIKVVTP